YLFCFFFSSRRRHTRFSRDWSSDVCSSDLGFRGEALPSIGSVARLSMRSRPRGADSAAEIVVDGGRVSPVRPVAANHGTMVEVQIGRASCRERGWVAGGGG